MACPAIGASMHQFVRVFGERELIADDAFAGLQLPVVALYLVMIACSFADKVSD
jgi:hypothetical protein